MRTPGLCLALVASAQLMVFSSPVFAQDNTTSGAAPSGSATDSSSTPAPAASSTDTSAAPATTAAPADATASAAPKTAAAGTVMVHVNSTSTITLQHRANESAAWETACTSPCDQALPVADQYQVTADNVNPSKPFNLDSSKSKVVLDVTPGDKSKIGVGTGFLIGGGVAFVAGAVMILANLKHQSISGMGGPGDDGQTNNYHTNWLFAGGALVFAGICAGFYGGGTILANNHSDVDGDVAQPQPQRGANDAGPRTAQLVPVSAPAFMIPVLHGTF